MLVLTRGVGESVALRDAKTGRLLGTVTVTEQRDDRVRLGFEFARDVLILRCELSCDQFAAELLDRSAGDLDEDVTEFLGITLSDLTEGRVPHDASRPLVVL